MLPAMEGKTCLITGATSGIGRETAVGLARLGARIVIMGRDADRIRATADWIGRQTASIQVACLPADLSSQAEVRRVAREFSDNHDRLDVLINNAGAIFSRRE